MNVTTHHYHLQQTNLNVFIPQWNMWVLFVNLSVICLNHLLKVMNLFVQLSYLLALYSSHLMLHNSWYQSVVTSAPCVIPVRITTATFPFHMRNICYANPPIRSFLQSLKLPLLLSLSSFFSSKICTYFHY